MKATGNTGFIARDDQRRLLRVSGTDATDFLQSLITANVETLSLIHISEPTRPY